MWGEDWGTMVWGGGVAIVPSMGRLGLAILAVSLVGLAAFVFRRRAAARADIASALLAIALIPLLPQVANSQPMPHTFTNGQIADADEVNENFDALAHAGAVYRWAVWSSYDQACCWYAADNANLFGGVRPQVWGDGAGVASSMSSDKEVLRTLFTQKGYGGANALVVADQWESYSSTNSKHAGALFRIRNTTPNPIVWNVDTYMTAYGGWGEWASVALNGTSVSTSGGATWYTNVVRSHALTIPANRTSTAIFVSASGPPAAASRALMLAFTNGSLALPSGLEYVDDLDVAIGDWSE